jgi:SAM-dependent methyltransferase
MRIIKRMNNILLFWGFDPRIFVKNIAGFQWYFRDYYRFRSKSKGFSDFKFGKMYPILMDKNNLNGNLADHYFYQDLLVATRIYENKPEKHVDIGSRIDGFVAHVAAFREIEVFDIRPLEISNSNIKFTRADFMNPDSSLIDYTDSISCLHALEHFGLGRYGDPLEVSGHLRGLESIYSVLKKGGKFYFSSPIGPQRIEFNAHRVFSVAYLLHIFQGKYTVDFFSYIDDKQLLHENAELTSDAIETNYECIYGCGIFELTKI